MSLTSFGETQPSLAWDFNGTIAPYAGSVSSTTVTGSINYGTGKYGQDVIIRNPINGGFGNVITYNLTTSIPVDTGISFTLWVKYLALPASTFGTTTFVMSGTGVDIYLGARGPNIWIIGAYLGAFYDSASVGQTLITDTWYHMGLTVGNGQVSMYFNGVNRKTQSYTPPIANPITLARVGSQNGYQGDNVEIDDLRIYNTALSAAQVQSIYQAQGMPSRAVQTLAYPYDNVGITSSAAGLWSTRRLRSAYAGPVINVRRNSDNTQLDFIADQFGNLSNVQSAVTIDTWLTSTTGNVTTWYDQFRSNNFTQSTATSQPQIVKNSGKWVVFFNRDNIGSAPTFYSRMTIPNQISGIKTILFGINTIANTFETLLGRSGADNAGFRMIGGDFFNGVNGGDLNDFLYTGGRNNLPIGTYVTYWYNNNKYGSSLNIVNDSNPLNQWGLVIGSTPGYTSFGFNSLSDPQSTLTRRAFYGYLSEVAMFTEQISQVDAGSLYADQYISRTVSSTLTGAPLFNQLSQSAASSAVGAFSLRAVNGVTAKAVQVQAHPVGIWPPTNLTGFSTNLSGQVYGNGTYTVSSSETENGNTNRQSWDLFKIGTESSMNGGYHSAAVFTGGGGGPWGYIGTGTTTIAGVATPGLWIQIQLPINTTIVLKSYQIITRTGYSDSKIRLPSIFIIVGSNNGSDWTQLDSKNYTISSYNSIMSQIIVAGETRSQVTIQLNNYSAFNYYRLVVQSVTSGDGIMNFSNFWLYGDAPSYAPNAAQDFYADERGNLLTAPVVGTTLRNWLGGAIGYVTKWYDQSGKGNDASQNTAAAQPIIQRATKGPGYSTLWPGLASTRLIYGTSSNIFDSTNYSICAATKRTAAIATTTYYAGTNGQAVQYQNLGLGYSSDTAIRHSHYAYSNNGPSGLPAYAGASEPMAYDYFAFSQTANSGFREYSWRSGTNYTSGNSGLTIPLSRSGNSTIGGTNDSASFIGEIYELLVFTQSLYDLDGTTSINRIYQNQLSYTGT